MSEYVDIEIDDIKQTTDAAILVIIDDYEQWIPRSVIEDGGAYGIGDGHMSLPVKEWFAEKEGLI